MLNNGRKFGIEINNATEAAPSKEVINNHLLNASNTMNMQGVNVVNSTLNMCKDSCIFSNLQSETEEKTRECMCLCWCQNSHAKAQLQNALITNQTYPLTMHKQHLLQRKYFRTPKPSPSQT